VHFLCFEQLDQFGTLLLVDPQRRFELLALVFAFEVLELEVFAIFLQPVHFPSQAGNLLGVKLSVDVQELDLLALVEFFQLVNFAPLFIILLAQFIVLDFELFENTHLTFDLLLLSVIVLVLILFIDRM
jgi:hypothetical protein